jgi:hypothetical protein
MRPLTITINATFTRMPMRGTLNPKKNCAFVIMTAFIGSAHLLISAAGL